MAALAALVGVSLWVGFHVNPEPEIILVPDATAPTPSDRFNWELAALVLTGLGTTALALATGLLALSTWQDVRASQRLAGTATAQLEAAREANELTRREQFERVRPAVIGAVEAGSTYERTGTGSSGELKQGGQDVDAQVPRCRDAALPTS